MLSKSMFLDSAVFVELLNALYTHSLANMFIPTPTPLLWEEFSHAAITAQTTHSHISTISITKYSIIQLSKLVCCDENEKPMFQNGSKGVSNPGTIE